jgi:hypothetical protein
LKLAKLIKKHHVLTLTTCRLNFTLLDAFKIEYEKVPSFDEERIGSNKKACIVVLCLCGVRNKQMVYPKF